MKRYNLKAETKTGRNLKKLMNHHNEVKILYIYFYLYFKI